MSTMNPEYVARTNRCSAATALDDEFRMLEYLTHLAADRAADGISREGRKRYERAMDLQDAVEAELQRTLSWDWASAEYVAIMETVCGHLRELKTLLDPTGRLYREV